MEKDVLTLGIESSCDETAAAVVRNGRVVLSNVISSNRKSQASSIASWLPRMSCTFDCVSSHTRMPIPPSPFRSITSPRM